MLTSKERAELRAKANSIDTTLIVGKGGVSEALIADVEIQLDNRELVKGKVLESALMSAREVSDALSAEFGIATRPGAHCAPLLHTALGTAERGAVRFSFSCANTFEEVDAAAAAVREIAVSG